jgi:hypothetical protein
VEGAIGWLRDRFMGGGSDNNRGNRGGSHSRR